MEDHDSDPELEWSIQEYSSKENSGKMRWILNKGLTLGKNILVTGFVISSVPIVLPPLAVVSIIGFACSVPYGLFLASYACTNKLMSKLLPESLPPPYSLEYGTVSSTDEEVENDENGKEEGEDLGLYGDINRDKEEEEMWKDTGKTVMMRIGLDENDEGDEGKVFVGDDEPELVNDVNEIVEENGHEKDVGEYVGEEEEEPTKEIEWKIGGVGEEEEKQPVEVDVVQVVVDIEGDEMSGRAVEGAGTTFEGTNVVEVLDFCADIEEEDEEFARETKGLLEKIREEGMATNGEEHKQSVEKQFGGTEEGDLRVESQIEEMEPKPVVGDLLAAKESDKVSEAQIGYAENVDVVPKETKPKPVVGDFSATKESDRVSGNEKSAGEVSGTTDIGSNLAEEQNNTLLNRKKEIVISSNAEAREIADESGVDLFDNKNAGEVDHNDTGISSEKDIGMASSKVFLTEEKILEQIEAMRLIVGYKGARQATCLEELNALYLFTGVEPPASFKEPSDLMEVNDKLRFLMSIVGVK
ncbi:hypothetical protein ACOSP7_013870 [Xanthoceras sorbifolium]